MRTMLLALCGHRPMRGDRVRRERMTNPSVKLDRRLTLMLPEVPILRDFFRY